MRRRTYVALTLFLGMLAIVATLTQLSSTFAKPKNQLTYDMKASNATLNRKVLGPVLTFVNGVPAEPVDSFVWNGVGRTPIKATAKLKIDPVTNEGKIKAEWTDEFGKWKFTQKVFAPPPHPTGLRIGSSASTTETVTGDPVTTNVYLHGDTGAGAPVLPTVFNLLTTWGPAEVTLNGNPFGNPFDGAAPLWNAHTMVTVGVRGDDGTVRTESGGIYNPSLQAEGAVDNDDLEFHLVFHDGPGPMTTNIPPPFSFFYHITFEDVKLGIKH